MSNGPKLADAISMMSGGFERRAAIWLGEGTRDHRRHQRLARSDHRNHLDPLQFEHRGLRPLRARDTGQREVGACCEWPLSQSELA
jgi:hypothetical protein